jgi:acyl-CoA thioester hydrolase
VGWVSVEGEDEDAGASLTCLGVAYPWQLDHMGHLNVQFYTALFDQATWALFTEIGLGAAAFRTNGRGMAALSQHTEYKREVFAGDVLEIRSSLLAVTEKTLRFRHRMRRRPEGELIATSELVAAHLDRAAHRAVPFPDAIRAALLARLGA